MALAISTKNPETSGTMIVSYAHVGLDDHFRFEVVAGDEEPGNRTAHQRGDHESKRGAGDSDLARVRDAMLFGKRRVFILLFNQLPRARTRMARLNVVKPSNCI